MSGGCRPCLGSTHSGPVCYRTHPDFPEQFHTEEVARIILVYREASWGSQRLNDWSKVTQPGQDSNPGCPGSMMVRSMTSFANE